MQPRPCYVIATQTKHMLQSQRVRPIFLTGQVPDGTKPETERLLGVLKDDSRYDKRSVTAFGTLEERSSYWPSFFMAATRTSKAVWPTQPKKVIPARFFRRKTGLEFHECSGVVLHIPVYHRFGLHQSSGYPSYLILILVTVALT